MTLFNKKLLQQLIARYEFPSGNKLKIIQKTIEGWQKSIKDGDLNKTKETSIQGLFLVKFFDEILGYTSLTSGKKKWHLIPEPKTEVDAQEADGSLGIFTSENKKTLAVIELKDAKTSLDKKQSGRAGNMTPVEQAFNYLNKFDGCKWAIISNFREIRIYSKMRGQGFYEKFEILDLHQENEFKKFYYIFNKENLINDGNESVIEVLAKNTTAQEESITKKFYEHYKEIRINLLNHLFEHNPEIGNLVLVEKTQKLLDRLIFTMVCEDSSTLLPAHLVKNTYDRAFQSFALSDSDQRAWTEFKGLFHAIDKGNKRVVPPINAYNGGLFKHDEVLDSLIIKDEIFDEIIKLTDYDFESELNVNVLGHIFEQSISDLEEIKEAVYLQLENGGNLLLEDGGKLELEQSIRKVVFKNGKRKKMGIYYTPEYITKYIVENTVGKYLEEHPEKLEDVKILDPACGSGAFLNQAHSYLLSEYKIRTEERQLEKIQRGESLTLWDTNITENDKTILLNNLFGVDLSPESVDITKLALWLKTAKATEPLQNLDNNIKCGNSIIDATELAGESAFDWKKEYKDIMDKGGFDVIVGNPPYIFARNKSFSKEEKDFYYNHFKLSNYQLNTFILFIEQAYRLLNKCGYLGFIVPNTWLTIKSFANLRKFVLEKVEDLHIINIYDKVFDDANVDTCILLFKKGKPTKVELSEFKDMVLYNFGDFKPDLFEGDERSIINISLMKNNAKLNIMQKISKKSVDLNNVATVSTGLKAYQTGKGKPPQTEEIKVKRSFHSNTKKDNTYKKYLQGKDVSRYVLEWSGEYLSYGNWLAEPRKSVPFVDERILIRQIPSPLPHCINACLTKDEYLNDINSMIIFSFKQDAHFLLAILNSKLTSFWFANKFDKLQRKTFPQFKVSELKIFPIPKVNENEQKVLADTAKRIVKLNKDLLSEKMRLLEILFTRFDLKRTTNLNNFHQLGWNELVEEIEKQKIKLDLTEEDKLNKWFNEVRNQLLKFETEIQSLEQSIDNSMYKIYDLNAEEIKLVENEI